MELHERSDGRPGRAGRHLFRRTGARESGAANDRFRGTADPGHAAGRRHRAGRRGDFRPPTRFPDADGRQRGIHNPRRPESIQARHPAVQRHRHPGATGQKSGLYLRGRRLYALRILRTGVGGLRQGKKQDRYSGQRRSGPGGETAGKNIRYRRHQIRIVAAGKNLPHRGNRHIVSARAPESNRSPGLLGHGRHDRHLGVADRCRTHAQCGQGEFQLFPDRAHAEGLRRVGHRAEHHPARVILHPAGIRSAFPRTADNRSLLQQGAGRGRRIPGKCGHSPAGARRGEPLPARQPAVQRSRDGGLDPLPERPGLRHKPATAGEKDRRQFDNPDRRLHDSPGGQLHRRLQHPPQQRDQLPDHAGQRQPGRLQRGQIHCREIRREIRKIPEPRRQFRMLGLHG